MKVVVGGQGFLGAAVVRELLDRGDTVAVYDRHAAQARCDELFGRCAVRAVEGDVADADGLARAFRGATEVYNFAGRLGTSELDADIRGAIDANITGAVTVFEAALGANVETVFYPSKPNVWLNAYTITKVAAEQFGELFGSRGLRVRTLRYFNAYGPGQAIGPVRKIIPTFALQAKRGEPVTVYGDGEQTVDMIYSEDVGRITVDYARAPDAATVADCGRGVALTVNEVAQAVVRHFGSRSGVVHLPMRTGEEPGTRLVADTARLRAALGDVRFAPWPETLASTLDWYAERHA